LRPSSPKNVDADADLLVDVDGFSNRIRKERGSFSIMSNAGGLPGIAGSSLKGFACICHGFSSIGI
jgi:hypothetical protein